MLTKLMEISVRNIVKDARKCSKEAPVCDVAATERKGQLKNISFVDAMRKELISWHF